MPRIALFGLLVLVLFLFAAVGVLEPAKHTEKRPNILLIVFEDLSPRLGAYGDKVATTPVLDKFADQSLLFENAFTTSGVCAPSRSSLITGHHQQSIGTHQMRTRAPLPGMKAGGPIEYDAVPPAAVKAFPELLRRAGYYTSNNGKTDYQFGQPFTIWDDQNANHPWRGRDDGQPFFAMVNILLTHESYVWPTDREISNPLVERVRQRNIRDLAGKTPLTDPASVIVPPYLVDTEAVRGDIARHYDNVAFAEKQVGQLLEDLEADGLTEETIVIVTTDHGDGFPRMKRSLYDSGIHVPLMVRFPDGLHAGERNKGLVSFVDFAPTILSLAGVGNSSEYSGRVFLGDQEQEAPDYIYAAADRHDNVPDRVRAVRDHAFKYIRNYVPDVPFYRPLPFRDLMPSMQSLWTGYKAGTLTDIQAQYFARPKPPEELYDLAADPYELNNLASDPDYLPTLKRMREALASFQTETPDLAEKPEADMIQDMWPSLVQPSTARPVGVFEGGLLVLSVETTGASIGYRFLTDDAGVAPQWKLYVEGIEVPPGAVVEAKAIRYGFVESPAVRFAAP